MDSTRPQTDVFAVFCTFPSEAVAADVAQALLADGLAACVNIVPGVRSIYRWKGEICDEGEAMAVIKTTTAHFEALRERLVSAHPYDCPEVLALPVAAGHPPYLEWVAAMCEES